MRDLIPQGQLGRLSSRDIAFDTLEEEERNKFRDAVGEDLSLLAFSAGIERENYTSRWANQRMRGIESEQFELDLDYKFQDDPANREYDPAIMVEAGSAMEAAAFRTQIDSERASLSLISASNWGVAGQVYGGIFQPHVAAGLAVTPYSVVGMIAAEATLEAGSEVLLHKMQKTRTLEESYWNVGLTAMGVGILGGAVKMVGKGPKIPRDVIDEINDGFNVGSGADSAGSARVVDKDAITAEEDALVGGKVADFFSIGQMSNLVNSLSDSARGIAQRLADNPLFTKAHAAGKTRGVSVEALHEAAMGRVVIATEKAVNMQKASGLEAKPFDDEVGIAMSNGDKHPNPKVQEAAEMYRKDVVGPIREAAERVGILESDEGLKIKVKEMEADIQRLLDEGAGPGSKKAMETIEAARAKLITSGEKVAVGLQKRVDALKAKLDAARKPGKDEKKRTAPAPMVKEYNAARSKLSLHKKEVTKATKGHRKKLLALEKQKERLSVSRKKLDEINKRLARGGTAFAESYFPRVYNRNKIYENWALLQSKLEDHFKADDGIAARMGPGEITELAIDTIQNMIGGRSQRTTSKGTPTAFRPRVLSMMDDQLEPFLEKGASNVMIQHAQSTQPYIMMREAFESRTMDEMYELVKDDYRLLIAKNPGKEKELINAQKNDLQRLQVIHDRLMHQVQRAVKPRSAMERVVQASKLWNLTTMLGGIVVSSLPDLARPISHYGLRSFGKGLAKTVGQFMVGKGGLASIQIKRTGAALQRTLNDRAMQLTDSLEGESKWMQTGQKAWSRWSGFDVYTDIMESIASHSAMDYVIRQASKVASEQPLSKSAKKQLSRMGLTEEDLLGLYGETMNTMGAQDTILKYMNTMEWKDVGLAQRVEAAIGSDVRRTIIRIGAAEKPAFMDETSYSWLFQFQSFALSSQNKIMVAGFQNMNLNTAQGLVAMMALGSGVGAVKGTLRGQDVSQWSAEQWVFEGIDRSGMIGALREPFNALRYVGAMTGITDGVPSRYAGQGWERAITAPAASIAGRLGRGAYAAINGDVETAADNVMKATPFLNNTWHIREVLQKMGEKL